MRALLIYPIFPTSFWSFEQAVAGLGKKAFMPPLCLVTVAALLPQDWDFRLVDRNVEELTDADWDWAELVLLSGMIAQRDDFLALTREAKRRGKTVVVGGPYPTSLPHEHREAGADFLVLDEGEETIPPFLEALEAGERSGEFRSTVKPDVTRVPVPRYDLLKLDAYFIMAVQYSRGCPFRCEFCDIIVLYGRKPRTKTAEQVQAELDALLELGWRGGVFFVDDNFVGNRRTVKAFLRELIGWQEARGYPVSFYTEASVDMADDDELLDLMVRAKFATVFLGIETPDAASLERTMKQQNMRRPLEESVERIARAGLRVMGGFIIGFDGETPGAGERVRRFATDAAIPGVTFTMLQALPGTALWKRLEAEGRLHEGANLNQTTLINFEPSRPVEEVAREYVEAFWALYEPKAYLTRVYRHFRMVGTAEVHANPELRRALANRHKSDVNWRGVAFLLRTVWRQGVVRDTRFMFWCYLLEMWRHNRPGIGNYLSFASFIEHFLPYRQLVRDNIEAQLAERAAAAKEAGSAAV